MRNQSILATPTVSVYTTPKSSQYILTMNSSTLNAKLVSPETKMCDKMMAITSYFKNELQFSDKAKDSCNSSNSKSTNPLQDTNDFEQKLIVSLKNNITRI